MSHLPNEQRNEDLWELVCQDHQNLTYEERLRVYESMNGD